MAEITKCELCQKPTNRKCAKCWSAYYCSKEHQECAWQIHQWTCRPFKIYWIPQHGYYAVATKPIEEGEIILQERSVIAGPARAFPPVCMGCLNTVKALPTTEIYLCQKCGWPVCNEQCEESPAHKPECYYFSRRETKILPLDLTSHRYDFLLILKCLFQKAFNAEVWKKINELDSDANINSKDLEWNFEYVTHSIHNVLNLKAEFTTEEIRKVHGVVNANSFKTDKGYVAVYETGSMFEHSCRANCRKTFNTMQLLRITAATSIKEGDRLYINYTNGFRPTFERQKILKKSMHFTCHCSRCLDVTEFDTYFSSLNCQNNSCKGILLPKTFQEKNSDWVCNECESTVEANVVTKIYKFLKYEFQTAKTRSSIENFLLKYEQILPKNNVYIIKAKIEKILMLGSIISFSEVSDEQLNLEIRSCQQMLHFLQMICPDVRELKENIINQLQVFLGELYRRMEDSENFPLRNRYVMLMERQELLNQLIQISRFSYDGGKHYETATLDLAIVDEILSKCN